MPKHTGKKKSNFFFSLTIFCKIICLQYLTFRINNKLLLTSRAQRKLNKKIRYVKNKYFSFCDLKYYRIKLKNLIWTNRKLSKNILLYIKSKTDSQKEGHIYESYDNEITLKQKHRAVFYSFFPLLLAVVFPEFNFISILML